MLLCDWQMQLTYLRECLIQVYDWQCPRFPSSGGDGDKMEWKGCYIYTYIYIFIHQIMVASKKEIQNSKIYNNQKRKQKQTIYIILYYAFSPQPLKNLAATVLIVCFLLKTSQEGDVQ